MNRLTAIGLTSLVAYGLLIAMKYTGVVSAARDDRGSVAAFQDEASQQSRVVGVHAEPAQKPVSLPAPLSRAEQMRSSAAAIDFRAARDLKAFADGLLARGANLTADERYHLAKALEECQFAMNMNEDLAAFSAKQRRQFLQGLTVNDPLNARRIAAYDAVDSTQRCLNFKGTKISQKEIDDLYLAAAQQGDPRAQARLLVAELTAKVSNNNRTEVPASSRLANDDFSRIIGLLQTQDPEATLMVAQIFAQSGVTSQLRVGPNGEGVEAAAFLGAFSLVACDFAGPDCGSLTREPLNACAYAGYCNAISYEDLYRDFIASPWAYSQADRYRGLIHTAINTRNWALIGLMPPSANNNQPNQ